jgi:hypothetical protein
MPRRQLVHSGQTLEEFRSSGFLDDGKKQRAHEVVRLLQHHLVIEVRLLTRACSA